MTKLLWNSCEIINRTKIYIWWLKCVKISLLLYSCKHDCQANDCREYKHPILSFDLSVRLEDKILSHHLQIITEGRFRWIKPCSSPLITEIDAYLPNPVTSKWEIKTRSDTVKNNSEYIGGPSNGLNNGKRDGF